MKKGVVILLLLAVMVFPTALAESLTWDEEGGLVDIPENTFKKPEDTPKPTLDPWGETIIISPVWQEIIGAFFGLNLKNVSTEISVKETIILFSVFIMFLIIILDILRITPFFKMKVFDIISGEFIAAIIITTIVSITGSFISLKDLFVKGVSSIITLLDWELLNLLVEDKLLGVVFTVVIVIPILFIIHWLFSVLQPIFNKYSEVSRAEAKGRILNKAIEKSDTN